MAMENETALWAQNPDPDVGAQSFFVGQISGGDYYNRVPTHVHLKGTRRTTPGVRYDSMQAAFQAMTDQLAAESNMQIDLQLIKSGQSYRLSPDEPIVVAVRQAYTSVVGEPMPLMGLRYTANASQFINIAGVPAVYYGADQHRAHANPEWVEIKELTKAAKVYLLSTLHYFDNGVSDD
jgi:acetylornithine deacetylase/succinyl-diaminopimelate desuccinylase-like protein